MSTISASTTTTTGYVVTSDTTGTLVLQTGSTPTTAVTIGSDQSVTTAGTINGLTVGKGAGAIATNTAVGASALAANTTGANNTAVGYQAGYSNVTGTSNVFVGQQSGYSATGSRNVFSGVAAGYYSTGNDNTGIGYIACGSNAASSGSYNTALGSGALQANTTASNNTAVGYQAGYTNTTGTQNVFIGRVSGYSSTSNYNTFVGDTCGYNTTGQLNSFLGWGSGYLVTSGAKNTIIGAYSGNQGSLDIRTASNYIVLSDGDGNPRCYWDTNGKMYTAGDQNFYYIARFTNNNTGGSTGTILSSLQTGANNTSSYHFVANTAGASDVFYVYGNGNVVNKNNSYGTLSDRKLKTNITSAGSQWEDVKALAGVMSKFNLLSDPTGPKQIGWVAQDVKEISSGLVYEMPDRDADGNELETKTLGIHTSVAQLKAFKALGEALERIEVLEAEIAALKGQA